ncbi:hypothetical protein [Halorussus aquaticus]|uniref:Uncharacterized protein n=1 Tax=Halorussus aquaticus TaxID=2953748 RepID=A0ABD5Q2L4_9EURY|nr:hypothetical protein [Halorussus aquaticus]
MKPRATPTDDTPDRIEAYERTNSDGNPELVLYNPDESHEWINAPPASTVELEDWR